MTNRERILKAIRGEMADRLAFAPRLDLWHTANSRTGTLPPRYKASTPDQIARTEGWALHKINPEYQKPRKPEDNLHWALGVLSFKEMVYGFRFSSDIEVEVREEGDRRRINYHTPRGSVTTTVAYTEEMRRSGVSAFWVTEPVLKGPRDYPVVGYLFENLTLFPDAADYVAWRTGIGEDGVAFSTATRAASPMNHIQKYFINDIDFYYHYHDYSREMQALAGSVGNFFNQVIEQIVASPAEVFFWGGNFDETITYPSFFAKEIVPWVRKASERLGACGKFISCHCDGENQGLMDLIRDSGMHVAESVCPAPMTKVTIDEYYRRWADKLTIFGGIPSTLLLRESTTDGEFEGYLDNLFKAVAPGGRMILGIADSTPPQAVFERLVRIGERVEKEGRLPLEGGAFRPLAAAAVSGEEKRQAAEPMRDEQFRKVQDDVLDGDQVSVRGHILELLERGVKGDEILQHGLLAAMEVISDRFRTGEAFIPEVLLSARVMNEAVAVLEPHLTVGQAGTKGRVMIGTVKGDMHDIGKNLVITMLRGVGYEVTDLGVDVPVVRFVQMVKEIQPDILGMSSLLTTTMPQMKLVIEALAAAGLRDGVKVMVGGAPVNEKYAHDIGADGYAHDAGGGVKLVGTFLAQKGK